MNRLSSNLNFFFYLVLVIVLVVTAGLINSIRLNLQGIHKDGLLELPIIILIGCIILLLIKKIKIVEYDDNNLYIHYNKNVTTVPFDRITKIKMIMVEIGDANFYKIEYKTGTGDLNAVRLLPNNLFPHFVDLVRKKKPGLKVKNWSHSLDTDI